MKLRGNVPENLLDLIVEQSSVDIPPSEPDFWMRQLRGLLYQIRPQCDSKM